MEQVKSVHSTDSNLERIPRQSTLHCELIAYQAARQGVRSVRVEVRSVLHGHDLGFKQVTEGLNCEELVTESPRDDEPRSGVPRLNSLSVSAHNA